MIFCCVYVWPLGVLLISLALCADAAIGNVQEKAMKLHNGSNSEMVLHLSTKKKKKCDLFTAHDFSPIGSWATGFWQSSTHTDYLACVISSRGRSEVKRATANGSSHGGCPRGAEVTCGGSKSLKPK